MKARHTDVACLARRGCNARGVVAVLYARRDSVYKLLPGCDVWDMERDARLWPGGAPVIAHPPCRAWGQLRYWAKPEPGERELALLAVAQVRANGGVVEHPFRSELWPVAGLPAPQEGDDFGGWTLPIYQHWWGHRARKATKLYIVGCAPADVPQLPMVLGEATHVVSSIGRQRKELGWTWKPQITHVERDATTRAMAEWLCELARRCARPGP